MTQVPTTVVLVANEFQARGTSAYTLRLAQRLIGHEFDPIVVSPDSRQVHDRIRNEVEFLDYSFLNAPFVSGLVSRLAARDLRKRAPALLHIQSRNVIPQGQAIARALNIPTLTTINDYIGPHEPLDLDPRITRGVIAVSEFVRDGLIKATGERLGTIETIYSGVDIPADDFKLEVLSSERTPVIGTAGPLEPSKGFEFFLRAAQQVLQSGREVEFLIAGNGPDERRLREISRSLGITKQVTFITNLTDFGAAVRAMDIFCLPSLNQGLGTIMLEAMAMARPVVATEVGAVPKIVTDGVTALLVPPSDATRLAERMREYLDNTPRAKQIGRSGRSLVIRDFSAERMADETVRAYQRVLSSLSEVA